MISSFKTSFANTPTSPQIVPDGQSRALLKVSDDSAARTAKLQAAGKPWLCVKHKITVTNEKCKAMKIASDTRQCSDCGLPLALGIVTREELQMAKTQKHTCPACGEECLALFGKRKVCWTCREEEKAAKVVPASTQAVVGQGVPKVETVEAFPSWESFKPVDRREVSVLPLASITQSLERICFNVALQSSPVLSGYGRVEVRLSPDNASMAFKPTNTKTSASYSLSRNGTNGVLAVACKTALKIAKPAPGKYPITMTNWGFIVHLDRPAAAKA